MAMLDRRCLLAWCLSPSSICLLLFAGWIRDRRGGHGQRAGELHARGGRQAVLQRLRADKDGGRRRGRQAPAHHGHRLRRQALHLQGAGRRQEVVQGRQEGRREGRRLLQRRIIMKLCCIGRDYYFFDGLASSGDAQRREHACVCVPLIVHENNKD